MGGKAHPFCARRGPHLVNHTLTDSITIDANLCVLDKIVEASCRACERACPRGAIVIDEEALGIDTDACDGCALCQGACPTGAIKVLELPKPRLDAQGMKTIFITCDRLDTQTQSQSSTSWQAAQRAGYRRPCLNAFGLADVLTQSYSGVKRWVVCHGMCETCDRKGGPSGSDKSVTAFESTLGMAGRLLAERGQEPPQLHVLSTLQWNDGLRRSTPVTSPMPAQAGRRQFFQKILAPHPADKASKPPTSVRKPVGQLLPTGPGHLPWVVSLSPKRCNGCDACLHSCPQGVIQLDDRHQCFTIDSSACVGCGLCRDVCTQQAVTLERFAVVRQTQMALQEQRCEVCQSVFHEPAQSQEKRCTVCRKINHRQHLHQVLTDDSSA